MKRNAITDKGIVRYLMEDIDQNWFSFFSGILANIPISMILSMHKYGVSTLEHMFFIANICVFLLSCVNVWFAFKTTVIKIQIDNQAEHDYEKWVQQNKTTSIKAKQSCIEAVFEEKKRTVKTNLICFFITGLLTIVAISFLWILNNLI